MIVRDICKRKQWLYVENHKVCQTMMMMMMVVECWWWWNGGDSGDDGVADDEEEEEEDVDDNESDGVTDDVADEDEDGGYTVWHALFCQEKQYSNLNVQRISDENRYIC